MGSLTMSAMITREMMPAVTAEMAPAADDDAAPVDAAVAVIRYAAVTVVAVVRRITWVSGNAHKAIANTSADAKAERTDNQRDRQTTNITLAPRGRIFGEGIRGDV